ncbi:MAG TPA: SDR family oxidoreductase [Pirellulales bacterium]|jgi:glucose 1-dehydrogenase|nr:SDR family oxidoreductase [Pirellulales bacterium]
MTTLAGKTALVTGSGRGIGLGCARELARCGASLVLNDRPASPDLAAAAEELRGIGRPCWAIEANAFSRAGCEDLVSRAVEAAGRIDILVANVATSIRGDFLTYDPADFQRVVEGTLISGFHIGQLAARRMVEQGQGGKIVFISSVHAETPYARAIAYNAAKAGLNHLAASMAVELLAHRINVNVIEPGWIDTPGERATFGEDAVRQGGAKLPWGRLGTPADIGQAVSFLASDNADYITGTVLRVDGGFLLKDAR